jgi:chromosome segregation ATPase
MARLNRILIIAITVLAIAAAVLSYFLFERRNDFRERAAALSETIASMVRALDDQSATTVGKNVVTFTARDPIAGVPEDGTLSWEKYKEDTAAYLKRLDAAEALTNDIMAQRNFLAESLAQVGYDLQMPLDELAVSELKNAADRAVYAEAGEKVMRLAKAVNDRSEDMIRAIVNCANTIEEPVDEREFRERKQDIDDAGNPILGEFKHAAELEAFVTEVTRLNARANDYAQAIVDAINRVTAYDWDTNPARVTDKRDYNLALTSLTNDFEGINRKLIQLEQVLVELEKTKKELEATLVELQKVRTERNKAAADLADARAEIKRLELILGTAGGRSRDIDPNLTGEVLLIDDQWRFVIVDLGTDNHIETNLELLAARNDELVARLLVTKVAPNIAVAEILPDSPGTVQVGDRIILPTR